jgi:FkbM family methyltransferase
VLDVGAHEGNYGRWLRAVGYDGRIKSFEPQRSAFAKLQAASAGDPLWDCVQGALGEAAGELEMNISQATVGSSLLGMRERLLDSHPRLQYVDREEVSVARLDSFAADLEGRRTYLKVDVQGYERQVLAGAGDLLSGFEAIEVELSMVPLYDGSPLAREVVDFLGDYGFELVFVEPVHDEPSTGYTLQADGVFVSRRAPTRSDGAAAAPAP